MAIWYFPLPSSMPPLPIINHFLFLFFFLLFIFGLAFGRFFKNKKITKNKSVFVATLYLGFCLS